MLKYRIFLIFSFFFSLTISSDLNNSLLLFSKFTVLILISVWLNHFVDFKNLLAASDKIISVLPSHFLRINLKKIVFSTLLGMEYCVSLISEISEKKQNRSRETDNTPLVKKNLSLFLKLFFDAFLKAADLEDQFSKKNISTIYDPRYVFKFCRSDYFILTFSLIILFLTFLNL